MERSCAFSVLPVGRSSGEEVKLLRILCIALTAPGLVLIATVGKRKVNYREIALWLILYILGKFLYGVVMQQCTPYISSQMTLFIALVLLAVILIPAAKPMKIVGGLCRGQKGDNYNPPLQASQCIRSLR